MFFEDLDFPLATDDKLGRYALLVLEEAHKHDLRIHIEFDYQEFLKSRGETVKPCLNRPGFIGIYLKNKEDEIVALAGYYPTYIPSLGVFMERFLQMPSELNEGEIPGRIDSDLISGTASFVGGYLIKPEYRKMNLNVVLRNAIVCSTMGRDDPDYILACIYANEVRRGIGIQNLYGLPNYSASVFWPKYKPETDCDIRLAWADRKTLKFQVDRILAEDHL